MVSERQLEGSFNTEFIRTKSKVQVLEEGFDDSKFEVLDQLREKLKYEEQCVINLKKEAAKNGQLIQYLEN